MHSRRFLLPASFLLVSVPVALAADERLKIETFDLAPAGEWLACAISPRGVHAAVLVKRGQQTILWDGAEGPVFDELLPYDGRPLSVGRPLNTTTLLPVAFSDDGEHHAYFVKAGGEYAALRDGREIARGKFAPTTRLTGLAFSPGGQHLVYVENDPAVGFRLFVDGQAGPALQEAPKLVFSRDGKRYAYTARKKGEPRPTLFVDGLPAGYAGDEPQFTRDSKSLIVVSRAQANNHLVLRDGKPLFRARHVYRVYVSPYGDQIVTVVGNDRSGGSHLKLFDQDIPDSECGAYRNVFFSPDGQRFAALGSFHGYTRNLNQVNEGEFIFLDGKRGTVYERIRDSSDVTQDQQRRLWLSGGWVKSSEAPFVAPAFTPDSSKFVYMPHNGFTEFVVVNEEASEGYQLGKLVSPVQGGGGKRIAWLFTDPIRKVVIDGQPRDLTYAPNSLSFSPDGSRVVYLHQSLCLDGADLSLTTGSPPKYLFSPDSQTFVVFGQSTTTLKRGVYIDGELVSADVDRVEHAVFTPDSKHLYWMAQRPSGGGENLVAFVDGRPAVTFLEYVNARDNWEVSPRGALTFVARTGDSLKRFRITPPRNSDLFTFVASAKANGPKPMFADAAAAVVSSSSTTAGPASSGSLPGFPATPGTPKPTGTAQTGSTPTIAPPSGPLAKFLKQVQDATNQVQQTGNAIDGALKQVQQLGDATSKPTPKQP